MMTLGVRLMSLGVGLEEELAACLFPSFFPCIHPCLRCLPLVPLFSLAFCAQALTKMGLEARMFEMETIGTLSASSQKCARRAASMHVGSSRRSCKNVAEEWRWGGQRHCFTAVADQNALEVYYICMPSENVGGFLLADPPPLPPDTPAASAGRPAVGDRVDGWRGLSSGLLRDRSGRLGGPLRPWAALLVGLGLRTAVCPAG